MINIMFCLSGKTSIPVFKLVINELKKKSNIFILKEHNNIQIDEKERFEKEIILNNGNNKTINQNWNRFTNIIKIFPSLFYFYVKIRNFFRKTILFNRHVNIKVHQLKQYYLKIEKILEENNIKCVVISNDRSNDFHLVISKVCKDKNIKSIIIPTASIAWPETLLNQRRNHPDYSGIFHIRAKRNNKDIYYYDKNNHKFICYYSIYNLYAYSKLKLLPKYPWVNGGGNSSLRLIEGSFAEKKSIELGCDESKVFKVGHPEYDELHLNMKQSTYKRANIIKKYQINSKKIVLLSLPQLFEHQLISRNKNIKIIREIASSLRDSRIKALVSLHPKMRASDYAFLQNDYGHAIIDEKLSEILPSVDLYLCTFSSTVYWSILCNVPVIIIDKWKLNYTFFEDISSLAIVKSVAQMQIEINKLLKESSHYETIKSSQAKFKADICDKFDGKSIERIVEIILI